MTTKFYSYSYKNQNGESEEEVVTIEDGKGKIVKKESGKIVMDKEITMEELEEYMEEKGLNIAISEDVLNQAVDVLNAMMSSKQGRKNLEQLQELDILDINDDKEDIDDEDIDEEDIDEQSEENDEDDEISELDEEVLTEEEEDQCKRILKVFGLDNKNPTKDEFLTVYNKLYNSYLQQCKGLKDSELEDCENTLKKLDEDFEAYSEEYDCWSE